MKKVVIIGGGIAGLTAGIFARKNGFESVILEKHHTLGGECTGWDRQGYHIDGCIHWLVGTREGTAINDLWKAVGALDGVECYHPETFLSFEHEGVTVHLYRDLQKLEAHWLEVSPQDEGVIKEFCRDVKKLHGFDIPVGKPMDMMTLPEKIKFMLSAKDAGMIMQKYGKLSCGDLAKKFSHPALREMLASFVPGHYSSIAIFFALANFTKGQASIPMGGSRAMALRMADRYLSLGGEVETSCEVVKLDLEGDRVQRVTCHNGKTFKADYFIAACDARFLYHRLLEGKYPDPAFEERFNNPVDHPLASNIYVALGCQGTLDEVPRTLRFPVRDFEIHGTPITRLTLTHYGYEPGFAPDGHSVMTCAINQFQEDIDAWFSLAGDRQAYREEKDRVGREVLRGVEERFPHLKGKVKVLDVATPKTYERYCNAYRGAFMPFMPTVKGKMMEHTGRIKGLKNLFLSGQWLQTGGGLPAALITGKNTIQRLCREEKRPFVSQ